MDETATALARVIGARVRRDRTERGWTLDALAERAGVSRRMLVNVEQGSVNPSVGTLLRLSDALGIGLPSLVEPTPAATLSVTRAGQGAVLWTGDAGGQGVLLAGTSPPDVVELWEWTLGPGERHISEAHSAGTNELIQVHDGVVSLDVDGQSIALEPGDAVGFPGDVPHTYSQVGDTAARFSLAVFEPGVGTRAGQEASHG